MAGKTQKVREWKPRAYREGDEKQLIELTKLVLERDMSIDEWNWLFKDNPAGKGIFSLADHDGKIVGQYVVIPIEMIICGNKEKAVQSMDTMTHPDYRRQGMFTTLAKEVYSKLVEENINVAYGFPNSASHPGFVNKLEWITLAELPFRARVMDPITLIADRMEGKFISPDKLGFMNKPLKYAFNLAPSFSRRKGDPEIAEIPSQSDKFDILWNTVKNTFHCAVIRNSEYIGWRYFKKPGATYKIFGAMGPKGRLDGYVVLDTRTRGLVKQGHIIDLLTRNHDDKIASALIRFALRFFRTKSCHVAACMTSGSSPYDTPLKNNGFFFKPNTLPYIVRNNTGYHSWEELSKVYSWYITAGDSDFL